MFSISVTDMEDFGLAEETNEAKGLQSESSQDEAVHRQTKWKLKKEWGTLGLWEKQWAQEPSKLVPVRALSAVQAIFSLAAEEPVSHPERGAGLGKGWHPPG